MELAAIRAIVRQRCGDRDVAVVAAALQRMERVARGELPLHEIDVIRLAERAKIFIDDHNEAFERCSSRERQDLIVSLLMGEDVSSRLQR